MAQITLEDMHIYLSRSQVIHLTEMDSEIFPKAYDQAVGFIHSQIGELFDVEAMLVAPEEDPTAKVCRYLLRTFTAWYMASSASQVSEPLQMEYALATKRLQEIKSGATVLVHGPEQRPGKTWGGFVSKRCLQRG